MSTPVNDHTTNSYTHIRTHTLGHRLLVSGHNEATGTEKMERCHQHNLSKTFTPQFKNLLGKEEKNKKMLKNVA